MKGKMKRVNIEELLGRVVKEIVGKEGDDELILKTEDGKKFSMWHQQDCCEYVRLEQVDGNLEDLIGYPILQAEESTNNDVFDGKPSYIDSHTWTFYKLATKKGYVTLRWLGESNGYYGEEVDIYMS